MENTEVSSPFARKALAVAERIDGVTAVIGRAVALLGFLTVLICFTTVYLRYALGVGFSWLQESYIWTHTIVIMFGSGFCLMKGGFVRVDVFYAKFSARLQAMIDLAGALLFTTPFLVMAAWYGWPFFLSSWRMNERSAYEDGLPALWLLKGTLIAFALVLGLQVFASICRNLAVLAGGSPKTTESLHG